MTVTPPKTSAPALARPAFLLLGMIVGLLIFGFLIAGLYQQQQVRRTGVARTALVVRNQKERGANILTLRYTYGPDTLQAQYTENHRRQVQLLQPSDSTVVRFRPATPRRVEVAPR